MIFSLLAKAVAAGFYFATDILIANILDENTYGEWCFFYSIVAMLFLFIGFGVNSSIRVKVARERESLEKQNSCICIGLKFRIVIGFVVVIVFFLASCPISVKLGYPIKYPELRTLFWIGIFLCLVNSFSEYYKAVYMGMEKFKYVFYLSLAEYGGYFGCGLGCLLISRSVYGLEIGYIIALLIVILCGRRFYINEFTKVGFARAPDIFERQIKREVLKDAIPFLTAACGTLVFAEIDTFMLGAFSTAYEVGIYSIAKNLIHKVTNVNLAVCVAMMPTFACIDRSNVIERQKFFSKVLKINICVALFLIVIIFYLAPFAISLFYGYAYMKAGQILRWLLLYFFLYMIQLVFSSLMDYQGHIRLRSFLYFMSIVLNIILNFLWIPIDGAKGAALATSVSIIPYDLFMLISVIRIFRRYKKIREE